ncbi:tethering complex subunit PEP3 NDAI_0G02390 [Naumovozyma dairenensis CBS 421]|uniref:Uncharacterized protein n=1 Tax=Naumovozyma dairenensis (strain ATCC 10597 / BCRC 20456 / CBS 421 / NBRC 0211 / NRRL Y-12639) TaxID=1071378 RepID=G0WE03_NAUDC|nr:hypothetical protein NDAI_0G02390 [Naumovozyma dairenensis CBS 421]CCD26014.2 hypothetical protein NDAI_0G02390 [Naumovozyma dairenensis CBS 421]
MNVDIENVQLDFIKELSKNITALQVKSNNLCFALKSGKIYLINLETPSNVVHFQIPLLITNNDNNLNVNEKLLTISLSPNADKLFIKTNFANYYILQLNHQQEPNTNINKINSIIPIKKLSKKKNYDIRAIEWINNDTIICGSTDGTILRIDSSQTLLLTGSKQPKVTQLIQDSSSSIDGILYHNEKLLIASGNQGTIKIWKNVKFMNQHDMETFFKEKFKSPDEMENFDDNLIADDDHHDNKIMHFTPKFSSYGSLFAWVTSTGIVFGDLEPSTKAKVNQPIEDTKPTILKDAKILLNIELSDSKYKIKDVIMTKFHIIIIRGFTITIINQLDNSIVFEESIWDNKDTSSGKLLGLAADYSQSLPTFWCFSNTNIYEIILNKESNAIWKLLCDQKKFDVALSLKDSLNQFQIDSILLYKGEHLLLTAHDGMDENLYAEAARCFGLTSSSSITSLALKFFQLKDNFTNNDDSNGNEISSTKNLQIFLTTKLNHINNKVQGILISSWIIWLFMKELNHIEEKISQSKIQDDITNLNETKFKTSKELQTFLSKNLHHLDKETIYQIISNQNRKNELLYFANLIEDYHDVLDYWITQENWYESLKILVKFNDPNLVYKYSNVLLINSPESTINSWMKIDNIDATELIPSILNYYTNFQKQSISTAEELQNYGLFYLKWYIEQTYNLNVPIIYNTVLYMLIVKDGSIPLVSSERSEQMETYEQSIINFLTKYHDKYDQDFILRLSLKFKRIKVSIFLYSQLHLYEDSINLALQNNLINLAKIIANDPSLDENLKLRKKLWLEIAKNLLFTSTTDNNDNERAIDLKSTIRSIINDSNNLLEIKDLLPFFNEFTTIANLKDELIKSLEVHSQSMIQTSSAIKKSLILKKNIKEEIKNFEKRYQILEPGKSCNSCHKFLQSRKFLVFPCDHCFHTDCLIKEILNSNDYYLKDKIGKFQKNYQRIENQLILRN